MTRDKIRFPPQAIALTSEVKLDYTDLDGAIRTWYVQLGRQQQSDISLQQRLDGFVAACNRWGAQPFLNSILVMCENLHMYCSGTREDSNSDDAAALAQTLQERVESWRHGSDSSKAYDDAVLALTKAALVEYAKKAS